MFGFLKRLFGSKEVKEETRVFTAKVYTPSELLGYYLSNNVKACRIKNYVSIQKFLSTVTLDENDLEARKHLGFPKELMEKSSDELGQDVLRFCKEFGNRYVKCDDEEFLKFVKSHR